MMTSRIDAEFSRLEAEAAVLSRERTPDHLRDLLTAGCFVYGAGGFGKRVLTLLQAQGFPCHGIIDRKFTAPGQLVAGVPALHPESFRAAEARGRCLVLGVHSHHVDPADIIAFGRDHAFREILWNADLADALGPDIYNYWLGDRDFISAHLPRLRAAISCLADDRSVTTAIDLFRYRLTGNAALHPAHALAEQYLPPGLLTFDRPITFVDGGAYDGDTFAQLRSNGVDIGHWIAFEPDPQNFAQLAGFARGQTCKATLFPCGLSDRFMHVPFAAGEGTSAHLGEGELTVACVALDDVLTDCRPDYIKLDIEGAEQAALRGMRGTIAKDRPALAVSAYHRPEDIWVLIETLTELAPAAKLYLRQHQKNGFDTVLYALPA
jgi:FkbM family methyltransferase